MGREIVAGRGAVMDSSGDTNDLRSLLDGALLKHLATVGGVISVDFPSGVPSYPRVGIVASEQVGDAARSAAIAALEALGYRESDLTFIELGTNAAIDALRTVIDALDPEAVITVDAYAADAVAIALPSLRGERDAPRIASGRRVVDVGDLAAALGSERTKREAWERFKLAAPRGPVY